MAHSNTPTLPFITPHSVIAFHLQLAALLRDHDRVPAHLFWSSRFDVPRCPECGENIFTYRGFCRHHIHDGHRD